MNKFRPVMLAPALLWLGMQSVSAQAEDRLNVVVTIAPVHSLAAGVMEGAGEPRLLLESGASAHTYSLKPSDAKSLQAADVIVEVSDTYEAFLQKALKNLPKRARIVTVDEIEGVNLLPVREGGNFEAHMHEASAGHSAHDHGHEHEGEHGEHDVHLWFDPMNAKVIVEHLAKVFAGADPAHAGVYEANAAKMKQRLEALDQETAATLEKARGKPFIVFHDVVQYFEKRYGLNSAGAITLSPERQPSAKRLSEVRAKIKRLGAVCVFSEPQFSPKLVDTLIDGTASKKGTLDEIGAGLKPGPDLYFEFIRLNAKNLNACLAS
jgi:zinc transport system substrate-binding protein